MVISFVSQDINFRVYCVKEIQATKEFHIKWGWILDEYKYKQ